MTPKPSRPAKKNFVRGITVTVTGIARALPGGLDSDDNLRRFEALSSQAAVSHCLKSAARLAASQRPCAALRVIGVAGISLARWVGATSPC